MILHHLEINEVEINDEVYVMSLETPSSFYSYETVVAFTLTILTLLPVLSNTSSGALIFNRKIFFSKRHRQLATHYI